MSLQALRSPVIPSTVLSGPLFTRDSEEGEAAPLESLTSSASSSQGFQTAFAESAAESDVHPSTCEGGEHSSTAECTLPYLLLSEALAGLPATFDTNARDKPRFYSYGAVNQQRDLTCVVAEKSGNIVERPAKCNSPIMGCNTVAARRSCTQEFYSSVPSSLSTDLSLQRSCFPDNHASKVVAPFEEALVTVQNCFNTEAHEINADDFTPPREEEAPKRDDDVKLNETELLTNLVTCRGESVARGRDEEGGGNVPYNDSALPHQPDEHATEECGACPEGSLTTPNAASSTHVPKPEDLERIAYVIRGFGLTPGPALHRGPPAEHHLGDSEILSGHDLAHFIGRRHTLPAKGSLEFARPSEIDVPADRVVHRRHSGPFLLPVFSFGDTDCGRVASEHVTRPIQNETQIDLGESLLSKPSLHSEQPPEGAGAAEVFRRNQIDGGNSEQAKYTLIVNVPPTTTRQDLHLTFSAFGVVELTVVVCDKDHRHPNKEWTATSGYAFVRFSKTEEAAAAVAAAALGSVRLRGSRVRATWAKKDSVSKHTNGGATTAGCSRGAGGNGKGFTGVSEPGTPALSLYDRVEDRGLRNNQPQTGPVATAPDPEGSGSASASVQTYGFKVPLSLCVTPESAQEFACHICRMFLAANPIVLPCWHLFCNDCLQQWKNHTAVGGANGYCCPNCAMWTATAHEKKMDEGKCSTSLQ